MTVLENMNAIYSTILDDPRVSTKNIVEILKISRERAGYIFHKISDKRMLSVKWIPKYLSVLETRDGVLASQAVLE